MFRKRLRGDDAADGEDDPEEKKTKGKAKKGTESNHITFFATLITYIFFL